MFPTYKDRTELLEKLSLFKPEVVCEVGVQCGEYAKCILEKIPSIQKIYLVDLWAHQEHYEDMANVSDEVHRQYMDIMYQNTDPWKEKITVLKGYSTEMCKQIPDESLDWVYIDARHDYKGCYEDLVAYWPKLKPTGIMSGHDYVTANEVVGQDWSVCYDGSINFGAVKGAVDDFAKQHKRQVLVSYCETSWHSWTILKN